MAKYRSKAPKPKTSKTDKAFYVILAVILAFFALILLFMLLWGFMTSLKSKNDFEQNGPISFPLLDLANWENPLASNREFFQFRNYGLIFKNFVFKDSKCLGIHHLEAPFDRNFLESGIYTESHVSLPCFPSFGSDEDYSVCCS